MVGLVIFPLVMIGNHVVVVLRLLADVLVGEVGILDVVSPCVLVVLR